MFEHPLRMRPQCPLCAYRFDRGNGYFVGAMYASYALSLGLGIAVAIAAWLASASVGVTVSVACAAVGLVGPLAIFPISRAVWVWVEREGWLHDGEEDREVLLRNHRRR
ncbi:MAG: hypothetical protein FJ100_06870 [Deltaproteobacteria bacterium]|nr:hypothetical protein [Deltaproteobacteria bacterium]